MMELRLRSVTWEAPGVVSLELVSPVGGTLPPWDPGAHLDLRLPDGGERQYSLCGDPADTARYRVAVREVEGGRVSRAIHRTLRPGVLLQAGEPRNNFALEPAERYLFIAGGIGITPLLPMMRRTTAPWTLLFCVRGEAHAPFLAEARGLGGEIVVHDSLADTRLDVAARLADAEPGTLIYCCGPQKLMEAVEGATRHWPAGQVRFEWFAARVQEHAAAGAFELVASASGLTLSVPPEKSILAVLTEAGIDVPRSCEQGVCGTCECRIIEGEADHRDSILSAAERAENSLLMTCVSRAAGPRLVLDI